MPLLIRYRSPQTRMIIGKLFALWPRNSTRPLLSAFSLQRALAFC